MLTRDLRRMGIQLLVWFVVYDYVMFLGYLRVFVLIMTPHFATDTDDEQNRPHSIHNRTKHIADVRCVQHGRDRRGIFHSLCCAGGICRAERPVRTLSSVRLHRA
jgi:hypothetical protein